MLKKFVVLFLLAACMTLFSGCNTIHGFGKDIEKVGEFIQKGSGKSQ